RIVLERLLESAGILAGLAEREMKLQAIVDRSGLSLQSALHGPDIGFAEAEGLEVRQREPGIAEMWREIDAVAISPERLGQPAGCLEHMPVVEPDPRLAWVLAGEPAIELGRLRVLAHGHEDRGLEIAMA